MNVQIDLSKEAMERYEELSKECRVPVKKLLELILEYYLKTGGKTHHGSWEEGVRVVIAWPNRAGYSIARVPTKEAK